MSQTLLSYEALLRFGSFVTIFAVMALWEVIAARRPQTIKRPHRWFNHFFLVVLDSVLVRLLLPTAALGVAFLTAEQSWGLLNILAVPSVVAVIVAFLLLDAAIYFQHRLFHKISLFWRLHRLHHADTEFDVTTALRFHPLEILLSMLIKIAVVLLLGAPVLAVLIFEILLNATAMFNHANVRLPLWLDRWLRLVVVTPDMHRVHHSVIRRETDSNFGFNLPWWDRLFGTYRAQPEKGHLGMKIGLMEFRSPQDLKLSRMLVQPFVGR